MSRFRISMLVLSGLLCACATTTAEPLRIDGSSPQACQASWNKLEASLNAQQRLDLDIALLLIGSTKQHREGTLTTSAGISPETVRQEIDGKSFREIVALGKATGAKITGVRHPASN